MIHGTNFVHGFSVKFGATASPTLLFVSATQVNARVPAHVAGIVDVTVTTPGGTSALSGADKYAYGPPKLTSFTPATGITGSTVTINGSNFVSGTTVKFGTIASPTVTFVSGTQVKAVVPNGAVAGKISTTTPAGTAVSATNFTPTLSITSFTPASGPIGTLLTINGVGFNSGSVVKFNGVTATSIAHLSSIQMKVHVPTGATTGRITVTNSTTPVGTVTSATSFTKT